MALWVTVALLLVRGIGAVLTNPARESSTPRAAIGGQEATDAFAVQFARAYLTDPSSQALAPFLAAGASLAAGSPPPGSGSEVGQAEVAGTQDLGGGEAILTVACELRDARTLYLAVPIARSRAGEVAVLGAPSIVAAPAVAGVEAQRPQPLAGSGAAAIASLIEKFLPAYLSSINPADLSYLLAPGASVVPLGNELSLLGISNLSQLGSGEGPRRTVIATARVREVGSGATYPLAYRLGVVRHGRWYLDAVQGALP